MARRNRKDNTSDPVISEDKSFRRKLLNINNLIGQANLSLYGTDRTSDIDNLNAKFQKILTDDIGDLTNRSESDITSFLTQIVSSDNKSNASMEFLNNQFMSMTGDDYSTVQSFIYDAYRNRLLEQSDLHEVASQLIELSEAILITRDAIISADVVEGRMSRSLIFENLDEEDEEDSRSLIEKMEKKFKLLEKIKNFIIPKTLEYGEYYAYVIPYARLFSDFQKQKDTANYGYAHYRESTITEGFESNPKNKVKNSEDDLDTFLESCYDKYTVQDRTRYVKDDASKEIYDSQKIPKEDFKSDLKNIMDNIVICNDEVPLPILEEGLDSIAYMKDFHDSVVTETDNNGSNGDDMFSRIAASQKTDDGLTFGDGSGKKKNSRYDFSEIGDCYLRMIEPTRIIPIEIMNTVIGYYFVQDEDITPLAGALSSTLYFTKFDEHTKQATIIDALAERVVKSFDKPFLKNNLKFKEAIVDCFNYYNLNEKKLKFQFIPAEFIVPFKIDEDVNGNGTSMIKKSLFYAKLYLMLLLFKIMSIILYSNDQKINYIKQSGIDKNIANKVQEIARIQQSRQINISDLFSYTTLVNKVGNGNTVYMPVGRSGERPIETEILSGQEVQLNSDLLEMLKNAYILGTGVPAAIVNYMQEADFAKVIEQNNTKFNGRVVNYQLDFNEDITALYQKLMRWSTNLSENVISNFTFALQPPKATSINTKSELINQYQTLSDFLVNLLFEDPNSGTVINPEDLQGEIREFRRLLAKDQLPMIDFDTVKEIFEKAKLNHKENKLKPKPSNGDSGDDDGLLDDLNDEDV
jgi:hypothetical protein